MRKSSPCPIAAKQSLLLECFLDAIASFTMPSSIKGDRYVWIALGVVVVLAAFWLLGFSLQIAGGLIHLLLVLAIAIAVYNFAMNRDARQ